MPQHHCSDSETTSVVTHFLSLFNWAMLTNISRGSRSTVDSHWMSSGRGWDLTFGTDERGDCMRHAQYTHAPHVQLQVLRNIIDH